MSGVATKPEIEFPDGPAPAELVIEDVVVGDGAEAVPGGNVTVHYVGVEFDTGTEEASEVIDAINERSKKKVDSSAAI